jgi:tetratricopeptide (TPR) repeat protein
MVQLTECDTDRQTWQSIRCAVRSSTLNTQAGKEKATTMASDRDESVDQALTHAVATTTHRGTHPTEADSVGSLMRAAMPRSPEELGRFHEGLELDAGRIRIGRRLGMGAMGTVYAARDAGHTVAVKVLNRLSAGEIYRLKNEFRRLVGVVHPNIVAARELIQEGGEWFFVMQLVTGKPLDIQLGVPYDSATEHVLRDSLQQLVRGVAAIHEAGLLHRDLKPNNVLVEEGGRVVILDFGLVSEQAAGGAGQTVDDGCISGTPGYMAPEQARGKPTTPASDWYAVGVMLYQLLTGKLPLTGSISEILLAKDSSRITPPAKLCPSVPSDLDALCMSLLEIDPDRRPSGAELLARMAEWPANHDPSTAEALTALFEPLQDELIGREAPLEQLMSVLRSPPLGPDVAWISAGPGMGKSTLLRHFARLARCEPRVALIAGRCYQQESVPYKAFDELIDAYTRFLAQLGQDQAAQFVPRNLVYAARLFPVLLRIPSFARAAAKASMSESENEFTKRRRAFAGLKDMFSRVAEQFRVVLVIEDMHWADPDSWRLLSELLGPPDPAPVFWIFSSRGALGEVAQPLLELNGVQLCHVPLDPLASADVRTLALRRLRGAPAAQEAADRIVAASEGVPLYALQLASYCAPLETVAEDLSLDHVFAQRITALSAEARELLDLAAMAMKPLPLSLARACGSRVVEQGLRELQSSHWVHLGMVRGETVLEVYHERIRVTALARLDEGRRREVHRRLAAGLQNASSPEPRWLVFHLMGAGQGSAATAYLARAAKEAADKLAFGRASDLYLMLLQGGHAGGEDIGELERKCADALANAGRSPEAAQAYVRAAAHARTRAQRDLLRRMACTQWLRSGYLAEGVAQLRETLALEGIRWPSSIEEAALRFVMGRVWIRLRGLEHALRQESEVPSDLLAKLDALYPAQTSLGTFDYVRGAYFASLALPLALQAGEPSRLVLSLGSEAVYGTMFSGTENLSRARDIRARLAQVVERSPSYYSRGLALMTEALCAYWSGDWARAAEPARRAEKLFDEHVAGTAWEVSLQRSIRHTVELHAGRVQELRAELPTIVRESRDRQDVYSRIDLTRRMAAVHLARGEADDAARCLGELDELLRTTPLPSLRHLLMSTRVSLSLYRGMGLMARETLDVEWKECRRMGLGRFPLLRVTVAGMQADCIEADVRHSAQSRVRELTRLSREVAREPIAWAKALSDSMAASGLLVGGQTAAAEHALRLASEGFRSHGMLLCAATERLKLERLLGAPLTSEVGGAVEEIRRLGVRDPSAWALQYRSLY